MADYGAELPEGFTLDEPQGQQGQVYGADLPEGFTLDEPKQAQEQPKIDIETRAGELREQGVPDEDAQKQLLNEFWDQGQLEKDVAEGKDLTPLDTLTTKKALTEGLKALPESTVKQFTNLYKSISQPKQTWEGLKPLLKETVVKSFLSSPLAFSLIKSGHGPKNLDFVEELTETPAIDRLVDDYKKTYGTYDEFKKVLSEDPARILLDIGSIILPSAKGTQAVALSANLPKVAKAAGVVAKGAGLTEPITQAIAVAKPVSKLAGIPMKFLGYKLNPSKLYQDAAKMSTALSEADRVKMVKTALDEGILPNLEGLNKMDAMITSLDDQIAKVIDTATETNKTMPVDELFKEFDKIESTYKLSGKSKESINAIKRIKNGFKTANKDIKSLTPKDAQKLKQRIYKDLRSYYEAVKSSPASVEAQQAMARASKEFLEGIAPEIKGLNKKDGAIIALRNALEKPASRIQNRAIVGMGSGIKTGIGTTIGSVLGSPELGVAAGISFAILTDPIVQSKVAIAMNKISKQGVKISAKTVESLNSMGFKQVKKAGKTLWTPPKRLASEQLLKASQKEQE